MDSETVDSCIQRILSSLYPTAQRTVLCEVLNVVDSCYRGDRLRFLLHFLIPAKHFLQSLQQDGCCSRFSLCVQEKVLIQLCRLDLHLLPSDFYLLLSPPAPAAPSSSSSPATPCVVLCVCASGRGGAEEEAQVVELDPSSVFSMSWLEEVNSTRQRGGAARLKNCLLASHDHIYRVPWEEVLLLPSSSSAPPASPHTSPTLTAYSSSPHSKEGQEFGSDEDRDTLTDGSENQWRDSKGRSRRKLHRSSGTADEQKTPSVTLGGCFPMVPSVSRGDEGGSDSEGEYVDLCEITHTKTHAANTRASSRPANTHTSASTHTSNAPAHDTPGDSQGDYIELCQLSPQRGSLTHSLLHRLRSHSRNTASPSSHSRNTASPSSHTANATTNDTHADGSSSGVSQTALCSRLLEGLDGDASSSQTPPLSPTSCRAPLTSCHRPLLLLPSPTPPEPAVSPVTSTSTGASSPTGTLTEPTTTGIVPSHTEPHTPPDTLNVTQEPPAETHTPRDTQGRDDLTRPDTDARSSTHTLPDTCTLHDAHTRPQHTDTASDTHAQLHGTECDESQCPDGSERGEEQERDVGGKRERKEREMKEGQEDRDMKEADEAMREEEEGEKDEGYVELEEVVEVIIVLQQETHTGTQNGTPTDTRIDTENVTQADTHSATQQATHTDTQHDMMLPDTESDTHVETQIDTHAATQNAHADTQNTHADTQNTHADTQNAHADTHDAQIDTHNYIQNDTHSDAQNDVLTDTQNDTDTENYLHIGTQSDMHTDAQNHTHAGTQADKDSTHAGGQTSLHVHNDAAHNDDTDANAHADTLTDAHTDTSSHTTHGNTHTPPDTCTLSNTHSVENKLLHAHTQQHHTHCVALPDTQTALDRPEPRPEQRGEEEEEVDRREEGQPQEEEVDDVGVTLESHTEASSTEDNIQTGTSSPEHVRTNSPPEHLHTGSSSSEHLHTDTSLSEPVTPPPPAQTQQDQSGAPVTPPPPAQTQQDQSGAPVTPPPPARTQQDEGPVSSRCSPVLPAACDGAARPPLTAIHQLNGSVLCSGAVCLPGTRDKMGRAVVTVCTRNAVWLNPGCNGTELLRILLYFFSTVRKEVRSLGLTMLVDARMCPPDPSLWKAMGMLQDNAPGSIHMVLMLTAKDQRLDTPSNIRVVLLSSLRSLYKHMDGSQLPVELSGSFSFCLSVWLDFRKRVEQLTNQCEDAVGLLQSTINSLDTPIPVTAQEAELSLSSNRDLMRRVLEDSRLVKLQLEGGASLSRLRKEESLSDDYRHALQSVSGVYEQVDELVHHLVKTSNCRTQTLLFVTEFSTLEEGFNQVTVWIEDVAEVKLRSFVGEDNGDVSLQELNKKQQDFTQFYNTACSMCQRGESLLKRLESLEVVPSADLQTCEDKVRSFCLLLQDFSRRVEETRQRVHKLLLLYRFLDKAYGWSLAAMRRLAGVTMEDCSQPEKCQAVIGCLESNRLQHPPIPDKEFEEMRLLAAEVGREAGLSQWHFAWTKCQEAKRTFERKLDTALRTQRDSAHRRLSEPINSIQKGLVESVYSNQACTDSTHSSQSSIDSYHSTQTAPDSSTHSNRSSDSINNNLGSPESNHSKRSDSNLVKQKTTESNHSKRSDSTLGKQKTTESPHSSRRGSDSTHCNQRRSDSTHSNQRRSDSTHSNQTSADSTHGNHHSTPDSTHGKQRGSGAWFCRRALSGVWGGRDRSSPPSATSSPYTPHQHFPRSVSSGSPRCSSSSVTSSPTSTLSAPPPASSSSCASRRPLLRKTQSLDCPSTPDVPRYGGASSCTRGHVGVVIRGLEVTSTEVTDRPLTPRHAWPTGDRVRADSHSATPPRAKGSKLGHIVDEMLCTEREYVRSLRYVVQHYYPEMERHDLPQDLRGKRSVIFGNLEKILDFHQQFFLRELEACHSHPLRVSHCFIRHRDQFGLYALYSKNKPKSDALLASHGNNFFKFKQAELGDKMDVASYLLKPIQRMSKYFLLLNELIKEVDVAQEVELTSLRGAALMVQFQLRHGNDLLAMDAIRDCDVNLKEQGQLVRQDEFTVLCGRRKYQRHIFLFEELVLFSKPKRMEGGLDIYVYKHSYKTADVGLTESSGDSGLRFEVWFRRRTGRIRTTNQTYVLQAATAEIKHAWTADIARILWNQATRNKELRTQELLSMGVGSKPFMDIKPSDAAINDRAIDYIKGRGARTRASIAVSVFDHSNPFKRSAVNHVTPDPSIPGPSSSLLGPLNLHMYSQTLLHPPQPDISSCIEEDETSSQPSITTESSGGSSRCLSGSGGSSGSDSGCVSSHLREALCEEVGSPSCTSSPIGHKAPPLGSHYMAAKAQIIGPATVV